MNEIILKSAENFLTNNREVMEPDDVVDLENALVITRPKELVSPKEFKEYVEARYRATDGGGPSWDEFVDEKYTISFGDKQVVLLNCADIHQRIQDLLKAYIEDNN